MHMLRRRKVATALLLLLFLSCVQARTKTNEEPFAVSLQALLYIELTSASAHSELLSNLVVIIHSHTADDIRRKVVRSIIHKVYITCFGQMKVGSWS